MKLASLILCLAAGLAQAAETPADYPQQVPLRLQGEGPWYRLQVPMSVQLAAAHADLRDLRVFDKEGEALPYALSAAAAQGSSTAHEAAARLFPLYGAEADPGRQAGLRIQRSTTGTLVEVLPDAAPAPTGERRSGWLLDAGEADFPFERLALDWSSEAEGFQHFRIEASDDLQHWRPVAQATLFRLSNRGSTLVQDRIEFTGIHAKYLRLTWQGKPPVPDSVRVELAAGAPLSPAEGAIQWRTGLAPVQTPAAGDYQFDTGGVFPVERVKIRLPQPNTIAQATLSARANAQAPWRPASAPAWRQHAWAWPAPSSLRCLPAPHPTLPRPAHRQTRGSLPGNPASGFAASAWPPLRSWRSG